MTYHDVTFHPDLLRIVISRGDYGLVLVNRQLIRLSVTVIVTRRANYQGYTARVSDEASIKVLRLFASHSTVNF